MASLYRQQHPESAVLYRVLATNFDTFLARYETLFQRRYGYFRPVVREVVERYLDCANPMRAFARIRCPECTREYLLTFFNRRNLSSVELCRGAFYRWKRSWWPCKKVE